MTDDKELAATNKAAICLARGLLALYQPDLKRVKKQIDKVITKQNELIADVHAENVRLTGNEAPDELQQMVTELRLYRRKLISVKKDMVQLHERAGKLKKRALKLQQAKQKIALQREAQIQREADMIAKPQASHN